MQGPLWPKPGSPFQVCYSTAMKQSRVLAVFLFGALAGASFFESLISRLFPPSCPPAVASYEDEASGRRYQLCQQPHSKCRPARPKKRKNIVIKSIVTQSIQCCTEVCTKTRTKTNWHTATQLSAVPATVTQTDYRCLTQVHKPCIQVRQVKYQTRTCVQQVQKMRTLSVCESVTVTAVKPCARDCPPESVTTVVVETATVEC